MPELAPAAAEIAAIGVLSPFRRRGIATRLTGELTRDALAHGISHPFLMAAGQDEARLYTKAGYQTCGEILHTRRAGGT